MADNCKYCEQEAGELVKAVKTVRAWDGEKVRVCQECADYMQDTHASDQRYQAQYAAACGYHD